MNIPEEQIRLNIVELKAVRMLTDAHVAQCISYLTTTG